VAVQARTLEALTPIPPGPIHWISGPRSIDIKTYTGIVERGLKPVRWIGSSRKDLKTFPRPVQRDVGQALYAAQRGEEYPSVRALQGFGGRAVLEIVAP
jgi:hypothetical protein